MENNEKDYKENIFQNLNSNPYSDKNLSISVIWHNGSPKSEGSDFTQSENNDENNHSEIEEIEHNTKAIVFLNHLIIQM